MYLVFNVFYFYFGVGQKDSGVGWAHLPPPPFATPLEAAIKEEKQREKQASTLLAENGNDPRSKK
jgi:hypothetical protein